MIQNDSNGSAKVALICIRRSISAWSWMISKRTNYEDRALRFAARLHDLPKEMEKTFPDADRFIRPGFDEKADEWEKRRL